MKEDEMVGACGEYEEVRSARKILVGREENSVKPRRN
jgi:hypothetical protein